MLGGRVGLDGIHGATFSSESLSAGSPATAVQIGDPITQKKFSDAIIREARDAGLYSSITACPKQRKRIIRFSVAHRGCCYIFQRLS
mgnify:CR=1 FL=1